MVEQGIRVGFVGVGNMGRHMARNLLRAGHDLTIFDIRREAARELLEDGARWAENVAELAAGSDIVLTSLPHPQAVAAVALGPGGIIANLPPGGTYVDLTTNSPAMAREMHALGRERGVDVLDSPVSGGVHGAESRRLTLMVGGEREAFERARPILEAISDNVAYCGASGAGAVSKIVNNMISLAASALVGEALALGVRAGLDLKTLFELIRRSSGNTWRMEHSFPKFLLKGNLQPGFALDLALKDLRLGKELAEQLGMHLEFLDLAESMYARAHDHGWGQLHSEAVVKLIEERNRVELRLPDA